MRFGDFLRTAVLLFGGAATALAVAAVAGAQGRDEPTLIYLAFGWWTVAALIGGFLGRRRSASPGMARLMSSAQTTPMLPEVEPGTVIFNRLWALAVFTVLAGAVAFLLPQVTAIAVGYAIILALLWRNQAAAVAAVEERDGVRFYVDRSSPFGPTKLLRTPGFRRVTEG